MDETRGKTAELHTPPLGKNSSLLENLTDSDVKWLLTNGEELLVYNDTTVIHEGDTIESLYIVNDGLLGVFIPTLGNKRLTAIGPGETIGEMSLLEETPSSATVKALETSRLYAIPRQILIQKISKDAPFAARFYRAISISISDRLRWSIEHMGIGVYESGDEETRTETWLKISGAALDFKHLMYKADLEALESEDVVPEETAKNALKFFTEFVQFLNHALYEDSTENIYIREKIAYRTQQEILPYLLLTKTAERFYSKPRGYPGDFISLDLIYKNSPQGSGRIGPLLDWCFLNLPPIVAIRFRKTYIEAELSNLIAQQRGSVARVTGIAAGPADELFETYDSLKNPSVLKATLIEFDSQALNHLETKRDDAGLNDHLDLLHFELGSKVAPITSQDLIYCTSLIDYLNDKLAKRLLNLIHTLLRPGGKVIISNFHKDNSARAFMDFILEWKICHRTEEDLNRLFKESRFKKNCSKIGYDNNSICMFAECVK